MQEVFNTQPLCFIRAFYIFGLDNAKNYWICFVIALVLFQNSLLAPLHLRYFFNSQYSQAVGIKKLLLPLLIEVQAEKQGFQERTFLYVC